MSGSLITSVQLIAHQLIAPSANNPRKHFDDQSMLQLVESIVNHGILNPLVVRKLPFEQTEVYEIIAGERRWRAAQQAGLAELPCRVIDVSEVEVAEIMLAENIDRHQLSPLEESDGVCRLHDLGRSAEEIASGLGRSGGWVQLRLEIPSLPDAARDAMQDGKLCLGAARQMLRLDVAEREDAAQRLLELGGALTEQTVRDLIRARYLEPKRRQDAWDKLPIKMASNEEALEDLSTVNDYVQTWGEGKAGWRVVSDQVGAQAAHPAEGVVSWGDLAEAHGCRVLLVPGSGEITLKNIIRLVDSKQVIDCERGAREAGLPFTLGPRKAAPLTVEEPSGDDEAVGDEDFEEYAVRVVADVCVAFSGNAEILEMLLPVLERSEIATVADHLIK